MGMRLLHTHAGSRATRPASGMASPTPVEPTVGRLPWKPDIPLPWHGVGRPTAGFTAAALQPSGYRGCRLAKASTNHLLPASSKLTWTRACAPLPS